MTHEQLSHVYAYVPNLPKQSPSGLRTRCSELVRKGKVEATSETRVLSTGRRGVVWRAVTNL